MSCEQRQPAAVAGGQGLGCLCQALFGPGGVGEWPARPAVEGAAAVFVDLVDQLGVDGDQGVAAHLVIEVAQVGGAFGVGGDAVGAQPQRVGDPQSAAHEHDGDQPVGAVVEPVEVGRVFELGHDLLGQCPGQQLGAVRVVLVVEGDRGGQARVPVVLADRGEQPVERADVAAAAFDAQLAQVGEVVLK